MGLVEIIRLVSGAVLLLAAALFLAAWLVGDSDDWRKR